MGIFNEFRWVERCPHCGQTDTFIFQGYIGFLELRVFEVGDCILPENDSDPKGVIGPHHDAMKSGEKFWAYGLANCGFCEDEVWSRIMVNDLRYEKVEIITPPQDPYDWGFLD